MFLKGGGIQVSVVSYTSFLKRGSTRTTEEEHESISWGRYEEKCARDDVLREESGKGGVERFVARQES